MKTALKKTSDYQLIEIKEKSSFNAKLEYEFFNNFESQHTRKSYRSDLTQFFGFIKDHFPDVSDYHLVERVHVVAFRNWLTDNDQAPKSVNRKIAATSSFYDFLIEKNIAELNPCSSIKRPRQEVVKPTNDLSDEDIRRLFELVDRCEGAALLHKAVIYTLFTTGIRKAELINLKRKNFFVQESHFLIEVKAKGGKILRKVVHPKCAEVIHEYIQYIETTTNEKMHPEDWIFRPTKNPLEPGHILKPLNPKSVDYIIISWCKKAGITHRISPHSARASYIGSALDSGIDLYKVSKDVGHASVKTTEEYNKRRQKMEESPVFGLGFLQDKKSS